MAAQIIAWKHASADHISSHSAEHHRIETEKLGLCRTCAQIAFADTSTRCHASWMYLEVVHESLMMSQEVTNSSRDIRFDCSIYY